MTEPRATVAEAPRRAGMFAGSLALATDRLSGAMLLALTGAMFALGHDGLTPLLALFGGVALAGIVTAPSIARAGASDPLHVFGLRYGVVTRVVAVAVAAAATVPLLAAEIGAVAIAGEVLSIPRDQSIAAALLALVLMVSVAGAGLATRVQAILFPALAMALALPVVWPLMSGTGGFIPPQLDYGATLQAISATELRLLESELADPVTLKAYLRPFISATAGGAALTTLSMALGIACLHPLNRRAAAAGSSEGARLMLAWALLLMVLAALALPALAASARLSLLTGVVGQSIDALPALVFEQGRLGLLRICGVPAVAQDAVAAACAALDDPPLRLRLDDIEIGRDATLLALSGLLGQPPLVRLALAAAVAAAAFVGGAYLLIALRDSLLTPQSPASRPQPERGVAAAVSARVLLVVLAAAGAWLASLAATDILTLLAWGFALAAGGLAPALVLGLWWSRANATAAVAGMLAGFAITAYYIVATQYFPVAFFEQWSALSGAGYGALLDYQAAREALQLASAEEAKALAEAVLVAARPIANWWGIKSIAAGALGAGTGLAVMLIVSLVTARPGGAGAATVARLRRPDAQVE